MRREVVSGARVQQHRPPVQPVLGSRTGAHAVGGGDRLGEGIRDGEEGQSDTDILTDPESGSDSDSNDGQTESGRPNSGGTESRRYHPGQTGSGASDALTATYATAAAVADNHSGDADGNGNEKGDGVLEPSRTENNTDEEAGVRGDGRSSPRSGLGSGAVPRDLVTSSPSPSVVLLKGGGGGSPSNDAGEVKGDGEGDAFGDGWSMVGSDDEKASGWGGHGEERGTDEEARARMIQWEFVNGYLDEVRALVESIKLALRG